MGIILEESWAKSWARQRTADVFGQSPKKKMNSDEFQKWLESCCRYGFVQAMEHLVLNFAIEPVNEAELLIGDAQVLMVREHQLIKKLFNGKVPDCTIEAIMEKAKAFKEQYDSQTWPTV